MRDREIPVDTLRRRRRLKFLYRRTFGARLNFFHLLPCNHVKDVRFFYIAITPVKIKFSTEVVIQNCDDFCECKLE